MTNIEEFQADIEYNEQHPIFAPFDDEQLGKRFTGRYERISEDKDGLYKRWFFDNGHSYTLDLQSNTFYVCDPIPPDYFVHKWIEKTIYEMIVKNTSGASPQIYCSEEEIKTISTPLISIRLLVDRERSHIYVTNIFVEIDMRHKGYGKQLLNEIYIVCKKFGYRLFLVQMVLSFYERMVARGAKVIENEDVVEITDETKLT